jgi:hypothetical protein
MLISAKPIRGNALKGAAREEKTRPASGYDRLRHYYLFSGFNSLTERHRASRLGNA